MHIAKKKLQNKKKLIAVMGAQDIEKTYFVRVIELMDLPT
jgi:hypothetical protein